MNERVINDLILIYGNVFGNYETGTLVTRIGNLMLVFSAYDEIVDCYGLGYENCYDLERDVTAFMRDGDLNIFLPTSVLYSDNLNFVHGDIKVELIRVGPVFTLVIPQNNINEPAILRIRLTLDFLEALSEETGGHIFFSLVNEILRNIN